MAESPPPPDPSLDQEIQAISDQLKALREAQKGSRTVVTLFTIALLVLILAFAIGLYSSVTTNLAPDKLEDALLDRAEVLAPELQRKAAEAVTLALPTYQELAVAKFQEIRPALQEETQRIVEEVPARLETKLGQRMDALKQSVDATVREHVAANYGSLNEQQIEDLTLAFTEELIAASESSQQKVEAMMDEQVNEMENIMVKFDAPQLDTMSDDELQRHLVASVAMLVVHMAQNPDDLPVTPVATGGISP